MIFPNPLAFNYLKYLNIQHRNSLIRLTILSLASPFLLEHFNVCAPLQHLNALFAVQAEHAQLMQRLRLLLRRLPAAQGLHQQQGCASCCCQQFAGVVNAIKTQKEREICMKLDQLRFADAHLVIHVGDSLLPLKEQLGSSCVLSKERKEQRHVVVKLRCTGGRELSVHYHGLQHEFVNLMCN